MKDSPKHKKPAAVHMGCGGLLTAGACFINRKGRKAIVCRSRAERVRILLSAPLQNGIRYCVDQFQFLPGGALQLINILCHVLGVKFCGAPVQLGFCLRHCGIMYDQFDSRPSSIRAASIYADMFANIFLTAGRARSFSVLRVL